MESTTLRNSYAHLDSYDINENNLDSFESTIREDDLDKDPLFKDREGLRLDYESLWEHWKNNGVNTNELWENIKESILCAERPLTHFYAKNRVPRLCNFELLGYDILIDDNYKPWLLEINHTPSLAPHTQLENKVKQDMLEDLFHLVDIVHNDTLLVQARQKLDLIATQNQCPWNNDLIINRNLLSPMDIMVIIETEYEQKRRKNFDICFPSANSLSYLPVMQMRNRTKLLALWYEQQLSFEDLFV